MISNTTAEQEAIKNIPLGNYNFPKKLLNVLLRKLLQQAVGGRPPRYTPPRAASGVTIYVIYAYG